MVLVQKGLISGGIKRTYFCKMETVALNELSKNRVTFSQTSFTCLRATMKIRKHVCSKLTIKIPKRRQ